MGWRLPPIGSLTLAFGPWHVFRPLPLGGGMAKGSGVVLNAVGSNGPQDGQKGAEVTHFPHNIFYDHSVLQCDLHFVVHFVVAE